jgi:Fe-S cluster assembly protein SufD
VVRGFFAELIHQIGVPEVEQRLIASIEAELEKSMSELDSARLDSRSAARLEAADA